MAELPGAKKKNNSNGDKKDRGRPLLFVFDVVALISAYNTKSKIYQYQLHK
jgi:hypothetical protein